MAIGVNRQLLIVGASGRAAAESARRAGMVPLVVDAFGDDDTRRLAQCRVAQPYPNRLVVEVAQFPAADWMFVGGLESSPGVVERIAGERRLLGIAGPILRKVRDPWSVRAALPEPELRFPAIEINPANLPHDGSWLSKSRRSSGGLGVAPFTQAPLFAAGGLVRTPSAGGQVGRPPFDTPSANAQIDPGRYFEQRVSGRCCGASFLADGQDSRLLGVVEQRLNSGDPKRPFLFGGAVGPLNLDVSVLMRLEAFGRRLAAAFGLRGLFGIDVILDGDEIWMLEVNPRYTASMELLEHAFERPFIADHVRACREGALPPHEKLAARRVVGKRIVYAGSRSATVAVEFTARLWELRGNGQVPAVADIPPAGSTVGPHAPLVTVLAAGSDGSHVDAELANLAADIRHEFERTCEFR
jgi:predicted ATP-grasp superfamily ATP-dependent carboligase